MRESQTGSSMFLVSLVVLLSGCATESSGPAISVTTRDSAGITIVENAIDTARARVGWMLSETPVLTIGGLSAPESQQLFQVSGGRRLSDGRIVVVDGGSAEVRVYGVDGTLEHAHGRKGEGPGEFTEPRLAGVLGADSLIVYDSRLRRVSVLHPDSGFARSYQLGSEGGGYPVAIGITAEGGLAVGGGMFFSSESGFPQGRTRPNSRYVILNSDGSVRGDLGDVPAAEMFAQVSGNAFRASVLPFGKVTVAGLTGRRLWLGTGDAWELRAHGLDAAITRIVRFERSQRPVTRDLRAAYVADLLESAGDAQEANDIRDRFDEMPSPDLVPPYQFMVTDALDHVWIGEYLLPGEEARTYTIMTDEGTTVGRLTLPPRSQPLDIGVDFLLAVTRDELDVEQLTLWELQRGG